MLVNLTSCFIRGSSGVWAQSSSQHEGWNFINLKSSQVFQICLNVSFGDERRLWLGGKGGKGVNHWPPSCSWWLNQHPSCSCGKELWIKVLLCAGKFLQLVTQLQRQENPLHSNKRGSWGADGGACGGGEIRGCVVNDDAVKLRRTDVELEGFVDNGQQ